MQHSAFGLLISDANWLVIKSVIAVLPELGWLKRAVFMLYLPQVEDE